MNAELRLLAREDKATREVEAKLTHLFTNMNSRLNVEYETDRDDYMAGMFTKGLKPFLSFLRTDLAPKIHRLHQVYEKHSFESPLNFIMVK